MNGFFLQCGTPVQSGVRFQAARRRPRDPASMQAMALTPNSYGAITNQLAGLWPALPSIRRP